MVKWLIISLIGLVPMLAFASQGDEISSSASLLLQSAIAAMQVYLTSKLPPIEKRLTKVEQTISDFVEGVVR